MKLEACIRVELDSSVTAEVVLKNYKGNLVVWSYNATDLSQARHVLKQHIEVFITKPMGEYVSIREYKAVKKYEEIYAVEEAPAVDITI